MNVYLDTAPLIYLVEGESERRDAVHSQIRRWIDSGEDLMTSCMTLMELLVHPKQMRNRRLENKYRLYLKQLLALPPVPIDERVADLAASIRAEYGFKTPDAFQLAVAVIVGADIFYTNDGHLQRFTDLNVVLVDG